MKARGALSYGVGWRGPGLTQKEGGLGRNQGGAQRPLSSGTPVLLFSFLPRSLCAPLALPTLFSSSPACNPCLSLLGISCLSDITGEGAPGV